MEKTELRAAVFLDRDGTIIEDRGHLSRVEEVALFDDTLAALRKLQEKFLLFIVTNQSGVAQGLIAIEDVDRVNAHLLAILEQAGVRIHDVYVCPHRRADGCVCVKPKRYFLDRAAAEYGLDLQRSFAIGDHYHDVELAMNAGGRGVFVRTGHGESHVHELPPGTVIAAGIGEAADWILDNAS